MSMHFFHYPITVEQLLVKMFRSWITPILDKMTSLFVRGLWDSTFYRIQGIIFKILYLQSAKKRMIKTPVFNVRQCYFGKNKTKQQQGLKL